MEEVINRCPNCSTWCNAEKETSSGTGALAGAATGAAAASFIPGIGTLILFSNLLIPINIYLCMIVIRKDIISSAKVKILKTLSIFKIL